MNTSGPVLRDIHVPPASWWPPAPGWWIVAALVVLAACVVAWLAWRHSRRRPLRAALREVDVLAANFAKDGDLARLGEGASRLLRRVARVVDPVAASRSGEAWRAFLHGYARDAATRDALDQLTRTRFRVQPAVDAPGLIAALRAWCRDALRWKGSRASGGAERTFRGCFGAALFASKGANAHGRRTQENATP